MLLAAFTTSTFIVKAASYDSDFLSRGVCSDCNPRMSSMGTGLMNLRHRCTTV